MNREQRRLLKKAGGDPRRAAAIATHRAHSGMQPEHAVDLADAMRGLHVEQEREDEK